MTIALAYAQVKELVATQLQNIDPIKTEPGHVITVWLFEHPEIIGVILSPFFVLLWYYVRKVNKQSEDIAALLTKCTVICDGIKNSNKRIGKLEDSTIQMKEQFADFKDEIEKCCKCDLSPLRTLEIEK